MASVPADDEGVACEGEVAGGAGCRMDRPEAAKDGEAPEVWTAVARVAVAAEVWAAVPTALGVLEVERGEMAYGVARAALGLAMALVLLVGTRVDSEAAVVAAVRAEECSAGTRARAAALVALDLLVAAVEMAVVRAVRAARAVKL